MTVNKFITSQIESMLQSFDKNKDIIQTDKIRKYAIISTPRVGSTLLCKSLQKYGKMGNPTEWFNLSYTQELVRITKQKTSFPNYLDLLYRGTTNPENHIFGVNFHVSQFVSLKKHGMDLLSLGFDKIYYVERANKFAQAYSLTKAMKSNCWSRESESLRGFEDGMDVPISSIELIKTLTNLLSQVEYYEAHLKKHVDHSFLYENFTQDNTRSAVTKICQDFGIDMDDVSIGELLMTKQSTVKDNIQLQTILASLTSGSVEM